ncbi:MAG TPA: DUF1326 domain-containing protein [Tepidisphaeraceae bacterium]|nr:DUF1326 domain-containing protein [Tepidisphaeraceae bacterium]
MHVSLFASLISMVVAGGPNAPAQRPIAGDYVEARTASVWAGGCHYSSEEPCTGRDAIMAWKFTSGDWKGVDLAGVRAVAVVSSEDNLANVSPTRRFELMVDPSATAAQTGAVANLIETKYADSVGRLAKTVRGPVAFVHEGSQYRILARGFASMDVQALVDPTCCYQEQDIWYSPLVTLQNPEVGYTVRSSYAGGLLGVRWMRASENSAFYGTFQLSR